MKARAISALMACLMSSTSWAQANSAQAILDDFNARLAKLGAPHVQGKTQVAGVTVPSLFFGSSEMANHYDIVDALRKEGWVVASIFVRDGDELVRVSTTALTTTHKRGVGTKLDRNAAYLALMAGKPYCGPVEALGSHYDACYGPIKGDAGQVLGATVVAYKK